jgi:hypothetical protein
MTAVGTRVASRESSLEQRNRAESCGAQLATIHGHMGALGGGRDRITGPGG